MNKQRMIMELYPYCEKENHPSEVMQVQAKDATDIIERIFDDDECGTCVMLANIAKDNPECHLLVENHDNGLTPHIRAIV